MQKMTKLGQTAFGGWSLFGRALYVKDTMNSTEKATLLKCIINAISFMSSGITSADDRLDKENIYVSLY